MPDIRPVPSNRRRATNVTLSEALVGTAKALGGNVSQACEAGAAAQVKAAQAAKWLEENRPAIEQRNRYVRRARTFARRIQAILMRFDIRVMARGNTPYVMDVQAEFTSHQETRAVIPIMPEVKVPYRIAALHPLIDMRGVARVLVTHMMTSMLRRDLGLAVESAA